MNRCLRWPALTSAALPTAGLLAGLIALSGLSQARNASAEGLEPLAERLKQMPVTFLENLGQLEGPAAFYIRGRDKSLYFTPDGVTFSLSDRSRLRESRVADAEVDGHRQLRPVLEQETGEPERKPDRSPASRWNVRLDFLNTRAAVRPEGLDRTPAVVSHLRGTPDQWKRGIPSFAGIRYSELWPGVDLVYRGTVSELKYEFVVEPGADPRQIRLAYRGAQAVRHTPRGEMEVTTPLGSFSDHAPVAYQEIDGKRVPVPARFDLSGTEFGFSLGSYDPELPLIIDPAVFIYVGYLGGEGSDEAYGVAVDGQGNAFVAGTTDSPEATFPAQIGPDLTIEEGGALGIDAFVAKVRADGTGLVYAGYLGGEADDWANSIALGPDGTPYLTGWTNSSEATFPVIEGPELHYRGRRDAWIARVTQDGTGLHYCGYIGGSQSDIAFDVAVSARGAAAIAGLTFSEETTFPVGNSFDTTFNSVAGVSDGFVAQVAPNGSTLEHCGYLGGVETDEAFAIAVDSDEDLYLSGFTTSPQASFPVVLGPDLTFNGIPGASGDAFVAKLRGDGSVLDYCGYIGGSEADTAVGIAVDGQERVLVGGSTNSTQTSFPVLTGPDLTFNGLTDAWVARVAASGTALDYCGYIGGIGNEQCLGLAVDGEGSPYLTGHTNSTERSFPVRVGPDLRLNSRQGGWIAKVAGSGAALDYAGYIEGNGGTLAIAVAVDTSGSAYVVGTTAARQDTFPVRVGPDLTLSGEGLTADAFIARIGAHSNAKPGAGRLRVSPARLSFGSVRGGRTRSRQVVIQNVGTGPITVNIPPLTAPFTITPTGDLILPRRGRATITVNFAPTTPGPIVGGLALTSTDPNAPLLQIPLQGRGL